ncbi:MAG: hypothetical protein OEY17_08400 [Nitrosopumilus sp.]|nr:hypothetical protein [Nitrosopumilus sp.]MDH5659346.1 hypothetical protein [Nitrosopumilus sp.]
MILVDKRMFGGGIAMMVIGIILVVSISETLPTGQAGMTEEETIELLIAQQENQDFNTLSGILIGVGFLLVLISFGTKRKKDSAKREEKKPIE